MGFLLTIRYFLINIKWRRFNSIEVISFKVNKKYIPNFNFSNKFSILNVKKEKYFNQSLEYKIGKYRQ